MNIPSWAYGLRYEYGLFSQEIDNSGSEIMEIPKYWLEKGNPWEIERAEIIYQILLGGKTHYDTNTG